MISLCCCNFSADVHLSLNIPICTRLHVQAQVPVKVSRIIPLSGWRHQSTDATSRDRTTDVTSHSQDGGDVQHGRAAAGAAATEDRRHPAAGVDLLPALPRALYRLLHRPGLRGTGAYARHHESYSKSVRWKVTLQSEREGEDHLNLIWGNYILLDCYSFEFNDSWKYVMR